MRTRDVARFLEARLDEAEARARACTPGPWRYDPTKCWLPPFPCGPTPWAPNGEETVSAGASGPDATTVCTTGPADDPQSMADAAHIAAHDPARVLADIAAKRQIVAWIGDYDADPGSSAWGILGNLAALHAAHPDYRQEWRSALDDESAL